MFPFARYVISAIFLCLMGMGLAQHSVFHIYKGDNAVGKIQVSRVAEGEKVEYRMTSKAVFSLIWQQHVQTTVNTVYHAGFVVGCHSSLWLNGSVRDSSRMVMQEGRGVCYVYPDSHHQVEHGFEWTTARMYFEEPRAERSIFVESVLKDCPLLCTGEGLYTLTFPNKTQNKYVYRNGVLEEVHVIRPLFDLIFRRI